MSEEWGKKARLRSMLYLILARLEVMHLDFASHKESGDSEILEIKWGTQKEVK